jgi:lysyl-tRNA synthetase class 1
VASYQAADRDPQQTLAAIKRTEYKAVADEQEDIIKAELAFIDEWLEKSAPEEVKFNIAEHVVSADKLSQEQKHYLGDLANKIEQAPADADGEWFHKAIYEFKDSSGLEPKALFSTLYTVLINKDYGPRAGWFIYTLANNRGKEWLVKRLRLQG